MKYFIVFSIVKSHGLQAQQEGDATPKTIVADGFCFGNSAKDNDLEGVLIHSDGVEMFVAKQYLRAATSDPAPNMALFWENKEKKRFIIDYYYSISCIYI